MVLEQLKVLKVVAISETGESIILFDCCKTENEVVLRILQDLATYYGVGTLERFLDVMRLKL